MKSTTKLLLILFGALMLVNVAYSESPREQLKQMVEQLQQSPNDNALREKIIKLAHKMKPAPAIPEEARRSFVRGNTAFSDAKSQDDYARAVKRYDEALLIAPWWGDPYFNAAKALELQQDYTRAIQSLRLFILTGPSAGDARKAQDYSYALEDKQEKLSNEKSIQEAAARAEEAKYGWLLGEWKVHYSTSAGIMTWDASAQASRNGNQVLFTYSSGFVGTYPDGSAFSSPPDSNAQPIFRATLGDSGNIDWQHDFGSGPTNCPTQSGWQKVDAQVSSDHQKFSITFPDLAAVVCSATGYYHEFTFTRE
ncbi:MAG: tetratricopeptide repeat protein [Sulfuricaulis sp.]